MRLCDHDPSFINVYEHTMNRSAKCISAVGYYGENNTTAYFLNADLQARVAFVTDLADLRFIRSHYQGPFRF